MSARRRTLRRCTVRYSRRAACDTTADSSRASALPCPPPLASPWRTRRGSTLATRHLVEGVIRDVNTGHVDLDDANAYLRSLGVRLADGPAQVRLRLPVAMRMIREDAESDIATLQCRLDEAPIWPTRLAGYLDGFRIARPTRAHVETGRRHTVVSTDLLLAVTVPAYTSGEHLVAVATAILREDLSRLRECVDILDEPTVHDVAPLPAPSSDDPDPDPNASGDGDLDADGDGWAYHADEFDDGNYINYGLDSDQDDAGDVCDLTTPCRVRGRFVDEWTDEVFRRRGYR